MIKEQTRLYPTWICAECAKPITDRLHGTIWGWGDNECGWCEKFKSVTHARNYGWPEPPPYKGENDYRK